MKALQLALKGEYFDAIKAGEKLEEFRLITPYWRKRIEGREYSSIVLTKGYPARTDHDRRIERPWQGYTIKTLRHPHFGPELVRVYAINVGATP